MERFCAKTLPEAELLSIGQHVAECKACHDEFAGELRRLIPSSGFTFTLAPEFWFQHDHIDFDQLVRVADNELDQTQREIVDVHLQACETCSEDVRSFLAFRKNTAQEMQVSYASLHRESERRPSAWMNWWPKPAYAAAVVLLVTIAVVVAAILLKRREANLEARRNEPPQISASPSPEPSNEVNQDNPPVARATESPKPAASPDATDTATSIAVLKDESGEIRLDGSRQIAGLDGLPVATRREIADTIAAGKVDRPEILNDLAEGDSTLRGGNNRPSFKLLSPERTVIVEDRPVFKWQKLPGATTYRVSVGDARGHEAATSIELSPETSEWTPSNRLNRGQIYSWSVVAVVDGKEIFSPGSSSPEMKFQILSGNSLQQLTQVKKTHSHLALGVFYAKVGLLREAEREFQKLVQLNPQSEVPRKLLRSVRSLSRSKNH